MAVDGAWGFSANRSQNIDGGFSISRIEAKFHSMIGLVVCDNHRSVDEGRSICWNSISQKSFGCFTPLPWPFCHRLNAVEWPQNLYIFSALDYNFGVLCAMRCCSTRGCRTNCPSFVQYPVKGESILLILMYRRMFSQCTAPFLNPGITESILALSPFL